MSNHQITLGHSGQNGEDGINGRYMAKNNGEHDQNG